MNGLNHFKAMYKGVGAGFRNFRFLSQIIIVMVCALSMAFFGCSAKGGKPVTKIVTPVDPNKPEVKAVVSALDSLVKANKGKGKGIITGFLTGEGKSIASGLLKQASNAAGERRLLTNTEIPLTGATILIFNALKPTTAPDTTLKTDSLGTYTCVLPEGKFFGFAVYLDLETFQLVTTSIPNMNPKADTIVKMDTATAIEDVTSPTVTGVYDASSANSDGIFLVGSVGDKGSKLNITFSEPMNRESAKGVILGRIDTTNTSTSMVLADTVKGITVSWNGDSKELTLKLPDLSVGAQYGLIMPVSLKDLAKNPLEKGYKATFVTVASAALASVPFSVTATFPEDKGEIKPIQNPGMSFSRPAEAFSILKNAKIEPAVTGYFEVNGARAVFIHKDPFTIGKTYTLTVPITVLDLSGAALTKDASFSFTVKDFEGAAKTSSGKEKDAALTVEAAFDAYLAGDVGRFGASFHTNFRLYNEDGGIKSKSEFLDMIRKDVGEQQAQSAGFQGPVFDNSTAACKDGANINRWKVGAEGGTKDDYIWVDAYVNPGQSPRAYTLDGTEIKTTDIIWDPAGPRFTYNKKKYGFGPDMSKFRGPVNMDAAKEDQRFMGDMLKQTSTVVLEDVKLERKSSFNVDPAVTISKTGDTAFLAVKMIDYEKFNRVNFGDMNRACNGALSDTTYEILKFILINDGAKWMIVSIVSPPKGGTKADFDRKVDAKDFAVKQLAPITLLAPLKNNGMGADGKVTFKFKGIVHDSVGGYIVGLSEDPKFCFGRPPYGALIFVKASNKKGDVDSLIMNSAGGPEGTNAVMILRRPVDLRLPGWDRTMFENSVTTLFDATKGFGGVYNWKVIAVKDSTAVQFLANGFNPQRYYGESDFGPVRGYFACKNFPVGEVAFNQLQTNQNQFVTTQPMNNPGGSFGDMDQDGVPDGMEIKYKTDPRDRNSFPDFRVDTDGDGLADFMEAMLDPKGTDSLVLKKADAATVKAEIVKLVGLGIVWQDTDSDGFPDDIEMQSGFNPNDPKSNPGTRARASAPIGVFAGKFQMGSNLNTINFKVYTDSSKLLWVTYTAIIGKDTLVDTARTVFNDLAGDIMIPVTLFKTGPDAGRALLLRGHYDPNQSLMMGPIDMITAVAKTTIPNGGGPYVGQFAASSRGEDVSRFLGGPGAGMTSGPINNPINNQGPMMVSYRLPPSGVHEGSLIILGKGMVTLVDDFGDTVAVVNNVMYRTQPDGSFQFQGETVMKNGITYKRSEVGGNVVYDGMGNWIVDGHFFQEFDSSGVHKSIPGQINAKAAKADMTPSADGITGTLKGWIGQDKTGGGFVAQPGTGPVNCDPMKGPCNTNPICDPMKGPCNTNPICDPMKGPCTTNPGPVNSFNRPFMSGARMYKMYLEKVGMKADAYFFVSMGGRVYKVKNDSLHVQDALAPFCGQVVLVPELLEAKDGSAISLAAHMSDSMGLPSTTGSLVLAIEDQFMPGMPARLEKVRDSYDSIRVNVLIIELRPKSFDYGKSTMVCSSNVGPINPVCDPTRSTCANTVCDPTKGACPMPVCDPTKGACPMPVCDPAKGPCPSPVACDPTKGICPPPPCDPAKGPCTGGMGILGSKYSGTLDNAKMVLTGSGNMVVISLDSAGAVSAPVAIDINSLANDTMIHAISVKIVGKINTFFIIGMKEDPTKVLMMNGKPVVIGGPGGTLPPPGDTTLVLLPPADTSKPAFYSGPIDKVAPALALKLNVVKVRTSMGLVDAKVNPSTISQGVGMITVNDLASAKLYIFLGDKLDPTKPFLTPTNDIVVIEKGSLVIH